MHPCRRVLGSHARKTYVVAAALATTAWLGGCSDAEPEAAAPTRSASPDGSASPSTPRTQPPIAGSTLTPAPSDPGDSGTASTSAGPSAPTAPASPTAPPSPGSSGQPGAGAELPPAPATPTPTQGLPPLRSPGPLVPVPLPQQASATGRLVDGFPRALAPVAGSRVLSSSLSPSGDRLQVALEASTTRRPDAVLRAFRVRLARYRLAEEAAPAVGGSQAAAFRRGGSSLVLTVSRQGSVTGYTVYGVLRAGS